MGCSSSDINEASRDPDHLPRLAADKHWGQLRSCLSKWASASDLHSEHIGLTTLFWMVDNRCPDDIYDIYFKLGPDLSRESKAFEAAYCLKSYPLIMFLKHFKPSQLESTLLEHRDLIHEAKAVVDTKICPLLVVIMLGDSAELSSRIESGVDINIIMSNGETPITTALDYKHYDLIQLLLQSGAVLDSSLVLEIANNPLIDFKKGGIIKYCSLSGVIKLGETAELSTRIASGLNLNKVMSNDKTPLVMASEYKQVEMMILLVQSGALLDAKSSDGQLIFLNSASQGYAQMVKALLEAGVDVNCKSKRAYTDTTYGIDIHLGDTALIAASRNGNVAIVHMLINAGAEALESNNTGEDAISVAKTENLKSHLR